ncbi:MAG: hypothetical protein ABIP21_04045 [Acidimicrobiia bacterium]
MEAAVVDPESVDVLSVDLLVAAHPEVATVVVGAVTWVAPFVAVALDRALLAVAVDAVVVAVVAVAAIEIPRAAIAPTLNAVVLTRARWAIRRRGRRGAGAESLVMGFMLRPPSKTAPKPP